MVNASTPSPLPFLLLGLVTGGALLYVSYWVWPPPQRRNSRNSRSNRRTARRQANNSGRSTSSSNTSQGGLRRSNATRRSNTRTQRQQSSTSGRDNSRQYQSDATSSDEEPTRRRHQGNESEEEETTDHEYQTLVDEEGYERLRMDDFGDNKHDGLQLMNLLYAIAEDQAGKEGHIHRGITCNYCRTVPIRGLRYKCANCQDYDLCEGCEAAEVHTRSHVFMKIRIPIPPLANSRTKKLPPFYPGVPPANTTTPDHLLQELLQKTHFDNVELDAMYNQYLSLSTMDQDGGGITRLTFEQALGPLGLEKNLVTERIFKFFDQDNDGIINFKEMACGLSVLCKGNFDEKIDFAFQGYDLDDDGYISRGELHEMFKAYFYLSMELIRDVVKTMENDVISNFEYQPGMPISATFTAPIPREIGVRNSNNNNNNDNNSNNNNNTNTNSNGNNNNTSTDRRQTRDQATTSDIPSELVAENNESSSVLASTTLSSQEHDEQLVSVELENALIHVNGQAEISTNTERLPPGSYGLLDSEAILGDDEENDIQESTPIEDLTELNDGEAPEEVLSSQLVDQEVGSDISEGEDSGVESNDWHAETLPSQAINVYDTLESSSSAAQDEEPQIGELIEPSSSSSSHVTEQVESTPLEETSSRPRKDQPLPPITNSNQLAPTNISTFNPSWERSTPSGSNQRSSSSYFHHSPAATPSLAPALAIGFGITPNSQTSPSASAVAGPSSSSSHRDNNRRSSHGTPFHSYASSSAQAGSYANASYFSSTFPVMESISQDAIQEMVDKTFAAINNPSKPGYITLEEFRVYVLTDAGILGWFDALGSIF